MDQKRPFLCGVIEGFYGKPWSADQRKELFGRMKRFGMQTYMYAPKDDYKHRLYWRDLYSEDEGDDMKDLIKAAKMFGITFVYALSPGLDIMFSHKEDVAALKTKLQQVKRFGCVSFALLFDDIDPDLCEADRKLFKSSAQAQAKITNEIFEVLDKPDVFLFCPTEYCTTRASPTLPKSKYLKTIGEILDPHIDVLWTGPKVISKRISLESILEVKDILKRPPIIWDNFHANDYDQTRMFLGPYDGRPFEVTKHLRGALTNPNCEYELNFIAFHTLAQWSKNTVQRFLESTADSMDIDSPKSGYQAKLALNCAIEDWIPEFYIPKGVCSSKKVLLNEKDRQHSPKTRKERKNQLTEEDKMDIVDVNAEKCHIDSLKNNEKLSEKVDSGNLCERYCDQKKISSDDNSNIENVGSPMDTNKDAVNDRDSSAVTEGAHIENYTICKKEKVKMDNMATLEIDDLIVLCHLFYLPYEYGSKAVHLLKEGHWLIENASRVKDVDKKKLMISERSLDVQEWYEKAIHFHDCFKEVVVLVDKLVNIPNRVLLYDLHSYVSDMRSTLFLVNSYIKWNGMGKPDKEPFRSGEQEPWVYRSGIYSEFRRLLPIEGGNDLFTKITKQPEPLQCFSIRPYFPEDLVDVYSVCLKTSDDCFDGSDIFGKYPDLAAEASIGGILDVFPKHSYVMEDDGGICGYIVCALDSNLYQNQAKSKWLTKMKEKYPDPCPDKNDGLNAIEETIRTFHKEQAAISENISLKYPSIVYMSVLPNRVDGIAASRRLLNCAIKTLKGEGSKGMYTLIHSAHLNLLTYYTLLEFEDISDDQHLKEDVIIMARQI